MCVAYGQDRLHCTRGRGQEEEVEDASKEELSCVNWLDAFLDRQTGQDRRVVQEGVTWDGSIIITIQRTICCVLYFFPIWNFLFFNFFEFLTLPLIWKKVDGAGATCMPTTTRSDTYQLQSCLSGLFGLINKKRKPNSNDLQIKKKIREFMSQNQWEGGMTGFVFKSHTRVEVMDLLW